MIYTIEKHMGQTMCDWLIHYYEGNLDAQERFNDVPRFNQITLQPTETLVEFTRSAVDQYIEEYGGYFNHIHDKITRLEDFRIKKYSYDEGDWFDLHIDANDDQSMQRYLAIFWYLNDIEEGGETDFPMQGMSIKPKQGRVVMFPPYWTHPHRGNKLKKENTYKYLLSTYLHLY
jgi:hypothetical protein